MSKIVKYTLNEDGTVPDFVLKGGFLATPSGYASPQDWTLVGWATADAPGESFATKADLNSYIVSLGGEDWVDPEGNPVDYTVFADYLWSLTA